VIKVGVALPVTINDAGEFLADVRALEAAGAAMIALPGDGYEQAILMGAIVAVTERVLLRVADPRSAGILQKLSRGRVLDQLSAGETWIEISMPPDRESWTKTLLDQEASGVYGVIVPWDPRLIDLLRNPEGDDRSDLLMSTG